jgi:hypothetical protein
MYFLLLTSLEQGASSQHGREREKKVTPHTVRPLNLAQEIGEAQVGASDSAELRTDPRYSLWRRKEERQSYGRRF